MANELLLACEVAKLLRVEKQRVYELARTNQIPVIRIGERQYRFSSDAIYKWLGVRSRQTETMLSENE